MSFRSVPLTTFGRGLLGVASRLTPERGESQPGPAGAEARRPAWNAPPHWKK
jgi:hypothetical protein